MNIRSESMLGTEHSWAITMRNLLQQFQDQGHKLYLKTINGKEMIPKNLSARLDRDINIPDIDICYTAPKNFGLRFKPKAKKKMAIYNYESSILPQKWRTEIRHLDFVLPSSNFSKEIFIAGGWPESKCVVIPHGINLNEYSNKDKYKLQTNKSFKFLNISIPHYRKNIDVLLDAYYAAFSSEDDVCLILKSKIFPNNHKYFVFEADIRKIIVSAQEKHKNKVGGLPQLELITERLDSIIPLYNACDVLVNTASSEGFGLPLLEALAADKIVIAPNCTGHLDFLNTNNAILVDYKEIDATPQYQYWIPTSGAKTYKPLSEDLSQKMLDVYKNHNDYKQKHNEERLRVIQEFTWENAAKKILDI